MADNDYTELVERLVTYLDSGLAALGYAPLDVLKGVWKPRALPEFERYCIFIGIPPNGAWEERRISVKEKQYTLRADVYLLVKNYGEELSLLGDTAPDLGLTQLISDVKDLLRGNDLSGLLTPTFNETDGAVAFESGAASGFDTGPRSWVHRARVPYMARTEPFCPNP